MSRAFWIPAAFIIFCALVLNFLASISLPYLPGLDIARANLSSAQVQSSTGISEIRVSLVSSFYHVMTKLMDFFFSPVQFGIW